MLIELNEVREMTKMYNTDTITDWRDFDDYRVISVDKFILEVFEVCEFRGRVGESKNIVFKIHPNEGNHYVPHVHAEFNKFSISISLMDYSIIAVSKEIKKNIKYAIQWVKDNIDWLRDDWDSMHEIKVRNVGRKSLLEIKQ